MTQVMLSHLLPIIALVSRYLTNKLRGRRPILGRNHTFDPEMSSGITHSFPWLSQTRGQVIYVFLSLTPLTYCYARSTCMPNPCRQRSF